MSPDFSRQISEEDCSTDKFDYSNLNLFKTQQPDQLKNKFTFNDLDETIKSIPEKGQEYARDSNNRVIVP